MLPAYPLYREDWATTKGEKKALYVAHSVCSVIRHGQKPLPGSAPALSCPSLQILTSPFSSHRLATAAGNDQVLPTNTWPWWK